MSVRLNGGETNYLLGQLAFVPHPGLDLDASLRVKRREPVSHWPVVNAIHNAFGGAMQGIKPLRSTSDAMIIGKVSLAGIPYGVGFGLQPEDELLRWQYPVNGMNMQKRQV